MMTAPHRTVAAACTGIVLLGGVLAGCGRDGPPRLTYFSNSHGLSLQYPAGWRSEQQEKDGVWFRYFTAPGHDGKPSTLSATLLVAPFTPDLDAYAARYMGDGAAQATARDEARPGLRGRSFEFATGGGATRHLLLLLAPDQRGGATLQAPAVFGLHAQAAAKAFADNLATVTAMAASLTLERAPLYPEQRNDTYGFALRVPPSWQKERTLSGSDSYLGQFKSPPIAADGKGNTAHAALTLAVQKAPGAGDLDSYYNAIRAGLGDAFPVLQHVPWHGGYADLMRTETQVSESRIKRYYRVADGRGYSLTCEAQEEQFARMDRWCDIIASSLRVGSELSGS